MFCQHGKFPDDCWYCKQAENMRFVDQIGNESLLPPLTGATAMAVEINQLRAKLAEAERQRDALKNLLEESRIHCLTEDVQLVVRIDQALDALSQISEELG